MNRKSMCCALLLPLLLSSCGTLFSRWKSDHIGAYPGEATLLSGEMMVSAFIIGRGDEDERALQFVMWFVSLPIDVVCDVVLLPADLVGWAFGLRKDW